MEGLILAIEAARSCSRYCLLFNGSSCRGDLWFSIVHQTIDHLDEVGLVGEVKR